MQNTCPDFQESRAKQLLFFKETEAIGMRGMTTIAPLILILAVDSQNKSAAKLGPVFDEAQLLFVFAARFSGE